MLRRLRQGLILLATLLFTTQVLAGPLFVCDDMRSGSLMTASSEAGPHDHGAHGAERDHQMMAHAVGESGHQSADGGHHCQHLCGLCLASTPFLSHSQQAAPAVQHPLLMAPHAVPLLDRQPDTPFRPPIFA